MSSPSKEAFAMKNIFKVFPALSTKSFLSVGCFHTRLHLAMKNSFSHHKKNFPTPEAYLCLLAGVAMLVLVYDLFVFEIMTVSVAGWRVGGWKNWISTWAWRVVRQRMKKRGRKKWKWLRTQKKLSFHLCCIYFPAVLGQLFVGWDRLERRSFFCVPFNIIRHVFS